MKKPALASTTLWGLLLLLGCALVYAPALKLGFVWDDNALVIDYGSVLSDPGRLAVGLLTDLWAAGEQPVIDSGYYRPLMLLSLALDRTLFGLSPWGYHLHSILWHLLAVGLLYRLLIRLCGAPQALAGAALFAFHPLHAEAVLWIAARNDAIAAALSLAALSVLWPPRPGRLRLLAGGLLAMLAVLGKESALLLPGFIVLLDHARSEVPSPSRSRPVVACAGVLAALLLRAVSGVGAGELPLWSTVRFFIAALPSIAGLQLSMLVWPWPLSGGRALEWLSVSPGTAALGGAVLACGALVTLWLPQRPRRIALAGLGIAALGYAPALLPLSTKGLLGERYLYLPMAGVSVWLSAVGMAAPRAALGCGLAAVLGGAAVISARLPDWQSDLTLWSAAMRDTPNPYVYSGLGHTLNHDDALGDRAAASRLLAAALEADPPMKDACGVVITATLLSGQPAAAAHLGLWSLERGCPRDGDFAGRLSVAQAFAGDWDAARETLAAGPADPQRRDEVVRAALLRLDGDEAGYTAVVESWPDPASLDAQVERLLQRSP